MNLTKIYFNSTYFNTLIKRVLWKNLLKQDENTKIVTKMSNIKKNKSKIFQILSLLSFEWMWKLNSKIMTNHLELNNFKFVNYKNFKFNDCVILILIFYFKSSSHHLFLFIHTIDICLDSTFAKLIIIYTIQKSHRKYNQTLIASPLRDIIYKRPQT